MKDLLVTAVLLISFVSGYTQGDFRNSVWGSSMEQAKGAEEGEPTTATDSTMIYEKQGFVGFKGNYEYTFVHDQLVSGKFVQKEHQTNKNIYIANFDKVKEHLTKTYGQPKSDEKKWNDEKSPYKGTAGMWGHAISEGTLEFWTKWDTPKTEIILSLTGGNYKVNLVVDYVGKYTVIEPKASGSKGKDKKKKKK